MGGINALDGNWLSFEQALDLTLGTIEALPSESVPLLELAGRVTAAEATSPVDVPMEDVSLKDGYAVRSADLVDAGGGVQLRLIGTAVAGRPFMGEVSPGAAVRVLTGASLPPGADAVVAEEFTRRADDTLTMWAGAGAGRNILRRGTDLLAGGRMIGAGVVLRPAQVGLLAAAGYARLEVVRRPQVAILAIGDELVSPGDALGPGQVYTSNQATLAAWCTHFGFHSEVGVVGDDEEAIARQLLEANRTCDVTVSTGGAWGSERDLVVGVLDRLGWIRRYHRVKLGPGKAVAFGMLGDKPVFCLPGGPPSCQMAFLQLVLPALLKLAGHREPHLPWLMAAMGEEVTGQVEWTQVIEGRIVPTGDGMQFQPRKLSSRLQSMADAEGFVRLPAGTGVIPRGAVVPIQILPDVLTRRDRSDLPGSCPREAASSQAAPAAIPPVVAFVAKSGAGKTTFLEQLIPELQGRGLHVGVVKHHAHPTTFDIPGKDTDRLAQAGAKVVVGVCDAQVAVFRQEDGAAHLEAVLARDLADVDLVLMEGFKRGPYPKIEVHRRAHDRELLCDARELVALVTDELFEFDVPQFALTDVAGVADFLFGWVRNGRKTGPGQGRRSGSKAE